LRTELYQAVALATNEPMQFELGDIELELSVTMSKEGGGGGKVRFRVVEFGADGKASTAAIQKVKLTLSPRMNSTGLRPSISGDVVPGEGAGPKTAEALPSSI